MLKPGRRYVVNIITLRECYETHVKLYTKLTFQKSSDSLTLHIGNTYYYRE